MPRGFAENIHPHRRGIDALLRPIKNVDAQHPKKLWGNEFLPS